jgi:hypothetical protein
MKNELLLYKAELVNWSAVTKYDLSALNNVINQITHSIEDNALSSLLHLLNRIVDKRFDSEEIEILAKHFLADKFEPNEDLELCVYSYIRILYGGRLNRIKGGKASADLMVKIIEIGLSRELISENRRLNDSTFRNLFTIVMKIQSYETTKSFIDNWYKKVAHINQTTNLNMSVAILNLYHERYDDMYENLIKCTIFNNAFEKLLHQSFRLIYSFMNRSDNYNLYLYMLTNFKQNIYRYKRLEEFKTIDIKRFELIADLCKKIDRVKGKTKEINEEDFKSVITFSWLQNILKHEKI